MTLPLLTYRIAADAWVALMLGVDGYAVLVVGGGPAGMAAAMATASAGLRTVVVDERPTLGGQVFKQPGPGFAVVDPARLGSQWQYGHAMVRRAERCGADFVLRTALVDLEHGPAGWVAVLSDDSGTRSITVPIVIVTPGAYDRPVAFPGWTLPGVVTAGGLQTLAKTQRVLPGRRMVFAGSGPVALAFPAQLADFGADIAVALEAGPAPGPRDVIRLARALVGNQDLLRDAARYRATLLRRRVPLRYRRVVVRAEGDRRLDRVVHAAVDRDWRPIAGTEETIEADLLCLGYGFVPSVELLRLVDCEFDESESLGGPVVRRDAWCRTSVGGIYAAGDGTGVEGSYVAIDEGTIAGLAAASDLGALCAADAVAAAAKSRRRLRRRRAFADAARPMYRVGPGLYELADEATVVCRCEEVTAGALRAAMADGPDVSVVKAATRAGMGPCQGRNCQRHITAMISRAYGIPFSEVTPATQRMPVRPVAIAHMADHDVADPGLFLHGQT